MHHDLIVVGAGIGGLSLAHLAARQGRSVLVLERAARPGGCINTVQAGTDLWLELGSHTLYNSYAHVIELIERCGLAGKVLPRRKLPFKMLAGGALRSIPSQLSLPELLLSVPKLLWTRKEGLTIREYYSRILGERNFTRVFAALFDAVACQDTADFAVAYLFKKRPSRRKDFPRSFTLEGGVGTLVAALAATEGVTLEVGADIASLAREEGDFQVHLADGSTRSGRVLALAVPPDEGARLLEGCFPDVASILGAIAVNRLHSSAVTAPRDALPDLPEIAGVVSLHDRFFSVVSRDVVPDGALRGFTFHFREDDPEGNLLRAGEVLGLPPGKLQVVATTENRIPALGVGHESLVRRLDAAAAGRNLLLTGNWLLGLSLEDCAMRSAQEAEKLPAMLA